MPTADIREVAEATTYTVIIGVGLLDQEIGLVLAVCSPAILMVILLGLFATPR